MNGLLVPPKDSNALAEAIKYLLSNPQLVKEMGIIGKKIVDGEVILLVADANRKNDGKIRIFEVTEHNFYKIFGDPEVKKFIIRAASRGEL